MLPLLVDCYYRKTSVRFAMFQTVIMSLNEGFFKSLEIFLLTLLGAIPLGLIISFGSMSSFKPLKGVVKTLVWIIRGSPLMLQLLLVYYEQRRRFPKSKLIQDSKNQQYIHQ